MIFWDTVTTASYPLSLRDALPICRGSRRSRGRLPARDVLARARPRRRGARAVPHAAPAPRGRACDPLRARSRSEEHTSELQSRRDLVCRLLLEKKKKTLERLSTAL